MYFSILVVMGLIVINATLTYYLFAVLRVSIVAGPTIGSIAMSDNGIVMRGETVAHGPLVAGVIRSKNKQPLQVISKFDNVSITDGKSNKLTISSDCVEVRTNIFRVRDGNQRLVFSLEDGKITIAQDRLAIERKILFLRSNQKV